MQGVTVDGKRFRLHRLAKGLHQRELALLAGVGERTVRNAEAGKRVRLNFLRYLAEALGVEPHELVDDRDELRIALLEQRRLEHVLAALQAHITGDFSGWLDLAARDLVYRMPGPAEIPFVGEYRGIDGVKTLGDRSMAVLEYERMPEISSVRASGNLVVINGVDCLRAVPTGKQFTLNWMHVYEFDKGHIVRVDNWGDTAAAVKAFTPG